MILTLPGDVLELGQHQVHVVHACNCKGVWGAGLAKALKDKYPEAYRTYLAVFRENTPPYNHLGSTWSVPMEDLQNGWRRELICMHTQDRYGTAQRQTNYDALASCLEWINHMYRGQTVAFPHGVCCGLGGGNWNIVYTMLGELLPDVTTWIIQKA